ncbi:MAG: SH3 domain-containing protein [Gammaproteobacteria bacterium]|nr:SH3 domain-containing protein [Gammaproteobacteria bacterium]
MIGLVSPHRVAACSICVVLAALSAWASGEQQGSPDLEDSSRNGGPVLPDGLEDGRRLYVQALEDQDPVRRARQFAEAERALRQAAALRPTPELLSDWGNAALGAGDAGRAALAFRRALALYPGHERAARNLAWLRDRAPPWLPRPAAAGALDSLLFWRDLFSISQRYWIAGGAFALAVLMLAPWPLRRMRVLRRLAIMPMAVWALAAGSAVFSDRALPEGVVVVDGAPLRAADSTGARLAFAHPLPSGAEVTVLETRDGWFRIALADGTPGWIKANSVERILDPDPS